LCVFLISWLYTEHRKDRMLKEQKEPEAMINHKNEDSTDHNLKNIQIIDTQKNTQKAEMINGIDNAAFESEQLWSHDLRDPFLMKWRHDALIIPHQKERTKGASQGQCQ